jgi:HSP20 family protein
MAGREERSAIAYGYVVISPKSSGSPWSKRQDHRSEGLEINDRSRMEIGTASAFEDAAVGPSFTHSPIHLAKETIMYATDWGFHQMFQDMERLLDHVSYPRPQRTGTPFLGHATPALNIWANDQAFVVTGEVPGVDPDSITISVMGDTLTVTGRRHFDFGREPSERRREFNRSIQLPCRVDADRTEARCRHGVLTVVLHRTEAEMPRKIAVQST